MSESDNSFSQLQKLYKIVQPSDLAGNFRVEKFSRGSPNPTVIGRILEIFVNTCDPSGSGLLQFSEVKRMLSALGSTDSLKDYIKIYDNVNGVLGSLASESVTKKTTLNVMSLQTPLLGISLRDTNRIGVFLNAIPSLELARCVPRLEVNFDLEFPGEQVGANNPGDFAAGLSSRSPTLLRYLNGTAGAYGATDKMMAKGSVSDIDLSSKTNRTKKDADGTSEKERWAKSSVVTSGMELFTTPQTLTSPDATLQARQTPVLDRFASLMSIESLEITAVPAGGSMSYKTAKLNLVVHDRSRLHEVAALIKPDAYSRSTLSLTYGWSHPDRSSNNPIADLINQMVVHDEKYNIVNSSFSFGSGAGVRIILNLAMKGSSELGIVRIIGNKRFNDINVQMQELSETLREARTRLPGLTKPEFMKEDVRVYQIIDAAANNAELIENYTPKDGESLKSLIAKLKSSGKGKSSPEDFEKLNDYLTKMNEFLNLGKEKNSLLSEDNKASNKTPNIDALLGEKFKTMIGHQPDGSHAAAMDPYFDKKDKYWNEGVATEDKKDIDEWMKGTSKSPRKFVSLAKLLLFYVGLPLQEIGTIDEVQFIYYPLNTEAGNAGGTNLAGFPIEIQYFKDVLADHARKNGNANMTMKQFIQLLNDTVLSDVRHPAYGMREIYNARDPKKISDPLKLRPGLKQDDAAASALKLTGGVFRKPAVELQVECRGGRPIAQGEKQDDKGGLRIIRIHVYDKLSSAYEPTLKLLEAQQGLEKIDKGDNSSYNAIVELAGKLKLNLSEGRFTSFYDLKNFISQVVPVLQYGGNSSGILAATMASMQNADLATVNMQRSMGQSHNSEPNSSSTSAIPLRVQPSQLDLTLLGCPLLNPAQQYFVDFNTGTTVDDLYTLTHLSHTINAGKFESTAKLTPMNSYGVYESIASKVGKLIPVLVELAKKSKM